MSHKKLTIGLFGFGVVGEGLYRILEQTTSLHARIKRICIKNPEKERIAPAALFTTDMDKLLNDPDINLIVEVINDADAAFEITRKALNNGKDVVSASKKMIAEHLPELLVLQQSSGRSLLYESTACASIPVLRNLEEYYDNDLLHAIRAIVNGSTNYILTKIFEEKMDFRQALLLAQQQGFAESDPKLDIEGNDAVNKWCLFLVHSYGIVTPPERILFSGIQHIKSADAQVAKEKNQQIKLVAEARKLLTGEVAAFVLPQFVNPGDPLAFVRNEYNGVVIESGFADQQFFYGKGAGSYPTASALLSDISALRYGYKYEYKKLYHHQPSELGFGFHLRVYISFDDWKYVPKENFDFIEEWHECEDRKWLIGTIAFAELQQNDWWRKNNCSLIVMPEPIIEDTGVRKLRKRSLELAGVF